MCFMALAKLRDTPNEPQKHVNRPNDPSIWSTPSHLMLLVSGVAHSFKENNTKFYKINGIADDIPSVLTDNYGGN